MKFRKTKCPSTLFSVIIKQFTMIQVTVGHSVNILGYCGSQCLIAWSSRAHWTIRPENFRIYSQLGRTSQTWFFTFLNVQVSSIHLEKTLISQLFPTKFRYFADQNGQVGGSHENEFWQFSNAKISPLNSQGLKSRWKNWGRLSGFNVSFPSYSP